MRKLFRLLTLILISFACKAQIVSDSLHGVLPMRDGRVSFQKTIVLPGLSKNDIYRRARRWWVYTYPSTDATLQLDDEKNGELIGKGYNLITPDDYPKTINKFYTFSTMRVEAFDDSMRVSVSQINITTTTDLLRKTPIELYKKTPEKYLIKVLEHVKNSLASRVSSLAESVLNNK